MTTKRPTTVHSITTHMAVGDHRAYITLGHTGNENTLGDLYEVFVHYGKELTPEEEEIQFAHCERVYIESIARLISLSLQQRITPEDIVNQLSGLKCVVAIDPNLHFVGSPSDGIAQVLQFYQSNKHLTPEEYIRKSNGITDICGLLTSNTTGSPHQCIQVLDHKGDCI